MKKGVGCQVLGVRALGVARRSFRQADWLYDMLLLVMESPPTIYRIQRWTAEEFLDVEEWAATSHLRASDNVVKVPPKPAVLENYK